MATILLLETSTDCCSAAICKDGSIIAKTADSTPKIHAARLVPMAAGLLEQTGTGMAGIDAVAVSGGPGSYTGLRVGVSTAKGLCFGAGVPLISVDTPDILAAEGMAGGENPDFIVPFIDARRMEVYSAVYRSDGSRISEVEAVILESDSYRSLLEQGKVLFIGTGVEKFAQVCDHPNARFRECFPLAQYMASPAIDAYEKKKFEDTAYFEPFYLKDFKPGISKKSPLL